MKSVCRIWYINDRSQWDGYLKTSEHLYLVVRDINHPAPLRPVIVHPMGVPSSMYCCWDFCCWDFFPTPLIGSTAIKSKFYRLIE